MHPYSYWREIVKDERLPAVLVDLDAFDRNLAKMASILSAHPEKSLRIATKSLRVPELIERVIQHGAPFRGLMCYSAEEARLLANHGLDDFLIAYPTVQPSDIAALKELLLQKKKVALVVDSVSTLKKLAAQLRSTPTPLRVVVEIDMSLRVFGLHLGVLRSPIRTIADLSTFLKEAKKIPEIQVVGAMGYEAQVAGLGDKNPFKRMLNPIAHLIRKLSVGAVARKREEVARVFSEKGIPLELFNGGGTGSLNFSSEEAPLTEVSAGSGLLSPHLFDYYSNIRFEPACFFALQMVRKPEQGVVTCQGGGYIASGEPGWDRVPRPYLPEATLIGAEGCGEVQTPLRLASGSPDLEQGDPVFFRHAKAGELAERFNEYLFVSGGKIVSRAKTYRGLGACFF